MKTKIMFVCLGNICRSPMAEFVMQDLLEKRGLTQRFEVASSATSLEEVGNAVHPGTNRILKKHGVPVWERRAVRITPEDYANYDYIVAMDDNNVQNVKRIVGEDRDQKIKLLLSFAGIKGNIADPWYTGNFERTYDDVIKGCEALLKQLTHDERSSNEEIN